MEDEAPLVLLLGLVPQQGAEPVTMTPDQFRKAIADEIVETGKVVRAIGLKAD